MDRRQKRILIAAIVVAVVALVLLLIWFMTRNKAAAPAPTSQSPQASDNGLTSAPSKAVAPSNPVALPTPPPPKQPEAARVAETFAQRYGSYSNQEQPYQNLTDLLPLMTSAYKAKVEAQTNQPPGPPAASYEGITSVKVSTSVVSQSDAAATVDVTLQQTKTNAGGTTVGYRTLRVMLQKVGNAWLVDSVNWQG